MSLSVSSNDSYFKKMISCLQKAGILTNWGVVVFGKGRSLSVFTKITFLRCASLISRY